MTVLGVALVAVAIVFFLAEAHLSAGGAIGIAAGIAAVGGTVLLLLGAGAGPLAVLIVALVAAAACATLLFLLRQRIVRPLQTRPRTGREALVGHVGVVRSTEGPHAHVFLEGSLWRAEPGPLEQEGALHAGDRVVVERVDGLTLGVRKAEEWELSR